MIRIYVGTDERQGQAEVALENSIREHTEKEFEIHWMRAGDDGFTGWKGQPKKPLVPGCWATRFTNFRYAVPELAGFEGRAIYLDSDMLVLGDIDKLWRWPVKRPWASMSLKRTDVSLIDCAYFKDKKWWPRIEEMRRNKLRGGDYRKLLFQHDAMSHDVPEQWDHLDDYREGWTKNIHYTRMPTQPWKPWPEAMRYLPHPCKKAVKLWQHYASLPSRKPEPTVTASGSPSSATPPSSSSSDSAD